MNEEIKSADEKPAIEIIRDSEDKLYICDRCGFVMIERNCKIECPNCGNRFDCSDLNIYFD